MKFIVVGLREDIVSNVANTIVKYRPTMNRTEDPVIVRLQTNLISRSNVMIYS